jgi:predicted ATP-dependent endonuclease of OLD family
VRLQSVQIAGYKRFASEQTLRLGPRVVAIVGPNEAGKTSLLTALGHLPDDASFTRREFTGRQQPASETAIVSARYLVEEQDRVGLEEVLVTAQRYTFNHILNSNGAARWWLDPSVRRDVAPREALSKAIATANEAGALRISLEQGEDDDEPPIDSSLSAQAEAIASLLSEAREDLNEDEAEQLAGLSSALEARGTQCADPGAAQALLEQTVELVDLERVENPARRIYGALSPRLPRMLTFDEEQRALRSDYIWADINEVPAALENLLDLAGVPYQEYRALAADRDRRDELSTLERKINQQLASQLAAWSQNKLTITLRADTESLAVHVTDEDTERDVPIEERSAGLRMFAALLCFCARYSDDIPPILLFDEAETHLHYGAQADLMDVFATQDFAQAVIYSTHSIGCLPEDLGRSIRVVAPTRGEESEIRNEFWSGGVGMTPLMLAMGSSAFAFSPARYAVLGEGPTEAILLPSMFRASVGATLRDRALGFQVASGTAQVHADLASDLETEAGNIAYLFDADEGGREHAAKLPERAHTEQRVLFLGGGTEEGLCTEDLLAAPTYADAVNQVLADTRNTADRIAAEDIPSVSRPTYVDDWCKQRGIAKLSKTRIAERALLIAEDGGDLIDSTRKTLLTALYRDLRRALKLKA